MIERLSNFLRFAPLPFALIACAQTPQVPEQLPPLQISSERLISAKRALNAFGYDTGPIDAEWNEQTYIAAMKFRSDVPGSGGEILDDQMFGALGIDDYDGKYRAQIYVVDERAPALKSKIARMSRLEIVMFLKDLAVKDLKKIDLVFSRPKSIVFAVFEPLSPGDIVKTYASNILNGKRNKWSQSYRYTVTEDTPTQPMIIINEFETGNPMYLIHHVYINDERVDARVTRADR